MYNLGMKIILLLLISYILGSLPFGIILSKVLFGIDVRDYGSHNSGGTNTGRVLGFKYGIIVIFLDGIKTFLSMYIVYLLDDRLIIYSGLISCLGHCYSCFIKFKGGKAVASTFGYLLGLAIFIYNDISIFIIPALVFFTVLYISKMVSLSSMISLLVSSTNLFRYSNMVGIYTLLLAIFVVFRHRTNIKRIINGTESKLGQKK